MKHWLAIGIGLAFAVVAADYTVPKTVTKSGYQYVKSATYVFDPRTTDVPVRIQIRVQQVSGDDRIDVWTAENVSQLPDSVTNSITLAVTTNWFKITMAPLFVRTNIVRAYNWALVDGRESSMLPVSLAP